MTICCISFHPCRSKFDHIIRNVQGQPSVIIWTNLVVLAYPMLIPSSKVISILVLKVIFEGFYGPGTFGRIFILISHGGFIWNLASNGLVFLFFFRKRSLKMLKLSDLGQRSVNDPDLDCQESSCTHLFDYMFTYIHLTGFNSFLEIYSLSIFLYKKKGTKFDLAVKYVKINSESSFEQIW